MLEYILFQPLSVSKFLGPLYPNCSKATTPKQNADFWKGKFERNMIRDAQKVNDLEALGWRVRIVWECETSNAKELTDRLLVILEGEKPALRRGCKIKCVSWLSVEELR